MKILILLNGPLKNDNRVKNQIAALSKNKKNKIKLLNMENSFSLLKYIKISFIYKYYFRYNDNTNINIKTFTNYKTFIVFFIKLLSYLPFQILNFFLTIYQIHYFTLMMKRKAYKFNPDVVHSHDLNTLELGYLVKKKCNSKLIYDSHELETDRNFKMNYLAKAYRAYLEKKFIIKADHVITVSESLNSYLRKIYSLSNTSVLFNAPNYNNKIIRYKNNQIKKVVFDSKNSCCLIYVGLISFNRGVEQLIDAFINHLEVGPKFKNKFLFFLGPMNIKYKNNFLVDIEYLNSLNIFFIPPVPTNEVKYYLSLCHLSVIPIQNCCKSYNFCFPNKLLESVFVKKPVAVSNLIELSKFVNKYKCGMIFDEKNPFDIAKKIKHIINNREKFKISKKDFEDIKSKYSLEVQQKKLIDIYSNL